MWRSAARVQRNVPFKVTSSTSDHWSSGAYRYGIAMAAPIIKEFGV